MTQRGTMKDGLCVATVSGGGQWGNHGNGVPGPGGDCRAHLLHRVQLHLQLPHTQTALSNVLKYLQKWCPLVALHIDLPSGNGGQPAGDNPTGWEQHTVCVVGDGSPRLGITHCHSKRMRQTFSTSMCPLTPAAAMRPSKSSKDPPPRACHVGTGHRSGRARGRKGQRGGPGRCRQGDCERTEGRDCCNRWCAQVGHVPPPALPVQAGAESRLPATQVGVISGHSS